MLAGIFFLWVAENGVFENQFMADPRFDSARRLLDDLSRSDPNTSQAIVTDLGNLVRTLAFEMTAASPVLLQEREMILQRVRDFSMTGSRPWRYFRDRGWDKLSVKECVGIGRVLSSETGLDMDREAKRRKEVMFKWMDDHWNAFEPVLGRISLQFTDN
jgi:hypothetical protein